MRRAAALGGLLSLIAPACGACSNGGAPLPASDAARDSNPAESANEDSSAPIDSSPVGDSSMPTDDSAIGAGWAKIPSFAFCPLFEADVGTAAMPSRDWVACGAGCLEAPMARKGYEAAFATSVAADHLGDALHWRVEMGRSVDSPGGPERLVEISSVVDGKILAAVRQRESLTTCILPVASTFLMTFRRDAQLLHGRAAGGPIRWQGAPIKEPAKISAAATWDGGALYFFEDGSVRSLTSPTQTSFALVDATSLSPIYEPTSGTAQVLWRSIGPTTTSLHAYAGAKVEPLLSADYDIRGIAQSTTRIAWAATRGSAGSYSAADLVASSFAMRATEVASVTGPALAVKSGLHRVVTWGDYAAALGCDALDAAQCVVLIVHLPTKSVTRIRHRPGSRIWKGVYGLTAGELVLGESDSKTDTELVDRSVRLQLSLLASFATW